MISGVPPVFVQWRPQFRNCAFQPETFCERMTVEQGFELLRDREFLALEPCLGQLFRTPPILPLCDASPWWGIAEPVTYRPDAHPVTRFDHERRHGWEHLLG